MGESKIGSRVYVKAVRPEIDPEAILELIRAEGISLKRACETLGVKYHTVQNWVRREKFNFRKRLAEAQETWSKRLAVKTAEELFPEEQRPKWGVAFLQHFRETGEQIKACKYAGITYRQLQDFCNPNHLHFNWWFAVNFQELLDEQQQEIRDRMITNSKTNPTLLTQIIRDFDKVQAPPSKDSAPEDASDDQILEALNRMAERIHEPADLPSPEPGPVQEVPS